MRRLAAADSVTRMRADVQDWFERRSWHARDFPISALRRLKGSQRVSVVLPALDEERTIGPIVASIRDHLGTGPVPLVDELVVMDSGSSDTTAAVATAAGAQVFRREDVLPEFAPLPGKGEVLWRGVAATSGDIVVYVDSDLEDFTPAFVTGLLGPLLTDQRVQLVKATYDRALRGGETVLPAGGGRVTELVARPLLNLAWPELAGFIQPLSGEYAARRSLLDRIPFPTGYGVEIAVLIDALQLAGLDALAQVDLVRRKHRNSSDAKLGQMAHEILQVALARLVREGRATLSTDLSPLLTQFSRDGSGYAVSETNLTPLERPAMVDVETYARGRGTLSA